MTFGGRAPIAMEKELLRMSDDIDEDDLRTEDFRTGECPKCWGDGYLIKTTKFGHESYICPACSGSGVKRR